MSRFFRSFASNRFWNEHSRDDENIESFINSLRTRRIDQVWLDRPPVDEEFGRRVAQALVSNSNAHSTEIQLVSSSRDVAGMTNWLNPSPSIAGETPTATLAPFTDLAKMDMIAYGHDMSVDDWDWIFRLLLTSTSLQELQLYIDPQDDHIMSALTQYVIAASRASLRTLTLLTTESLSEADFVSLCGGVAGGQLRKLILSKNVVNEAHLESAAESLSLAIAESSLEEVVIKNSSLLCSALLHTQPVRNLDFAISDVSIDNGDGTRMKINREWKPLLSATIPLALWTQILEKAHTSPETRHDPAGILFYILRERPDLVR